MIFQIFSGVFFHQIVHAPVFSVQEELTGPVFLSGGVAVIHQTEEKGLSQGTAVVQNQGRTGLVRIAENRGEGIVPVAFAGKQGETFLRKAAGGVAAYADAAFLIDADSAFAVENGQLRAPLGLRAFPVVVHVIHQINPGEFFIDDAILQSLLIDRSTDIDTTFVGEKVVGLRNQGDDPGILVALFPVQVDEVGGGHRIALIAVCVKGCGAEDDCFVYGFCGRKIGGGLGCDIGPCGVDIGLTAGIGKSQRAVIDRRGFIGHTAIQGIADGEPIRDGHRDGDGVLIEAAGRLDDRLL